MRQPRSGLNLDFPPLLGACAVFLPLFAAPASASPPWSIVIQQSGAANAGGEFGCTELSCQGDISIRFHGQSRDIHVQGFLDIEESAVKLAFADTGVPPYAIQFSQSHPLRVAVSPGEAALVKVVLAEPADNEVKDGATIINPVWNLALPLASLVISIKISPRHVLPPRHPPR